MGMIWSALRLDEQRAEALAKGLMAEDGEAQATMEGFEDSDDESRLDVDKAWHALDRLYAAAGATSPISTGRLPESDDVVAGLCSAARVKAVVAGMERIPPSLLRRGYDARRFAREDIYPDIWSDDDVLDVYLMPYDAELREFFRAAAASDEAIVWQVN